MKNRTEIARLTTSEVARGAGVHRDTLLRWLRDGLIPEPTRDRRGWRVFSRTEAAAVTAFANTAQPRQGAAGVHEQRAESIARLRGIDWQFAGAKTDYLTHGLHPYPAKYIPQIPNALIQELSSTGETIGDIFCGSGTTLVEALLLKRNAFGVDANPLAPIIRKAKTTPLPPAELSVVSELAKRAEELSSALAPLGDNSLFGDTAFRSDAPRPETDDLSFWFDSRVVEELAEARFWCRSLPTEGTRTLALACLSSIIVTVSKQDSDTRYVRRDKPIQSGETFRRFARSLRRAIRMVSELSDLIEPRFSSTVVHADLLLAPPAPPFDLVVCSPPYPNAYSYHLYHRTRMLWLELDQATFKRAEIGSHRKYSAKGLKAATIDTFRNEMVVVFSWLRDTLRRDRHVCFVVGSSTIAGRSFDNGTLLTEIARQLGYVSDARLSRRMLDTKKAFNPVIGKIKTEDILILRNTEGTLR